MEEKNAEELKNITSRLDDLINKLSINDPLADILSDAYDKLKYIIDEELPLLNDE